MKPKGLIFKIFFLFLIVTSINVISGASKESNGYNGSQPFNGEHSLNGLELSENENDFHKVIFGGRALAHDFFMEWDTIIKAVNLSANDTLCMLHMGSLIQGFANKDFISLKYFDSWAKIPSGILKGNLNEYGNFDECVDLKADIALPMPSVLEGKYCLAALPFGKLVSENPAVPELLQLKLGVCMPKSCQAEEFEFFYRAFLKQLLKINISPETILIPEEGCSVRAKEPLNGLEWLAISLLIILVTGIVMGTVYDYCCTTAKKIPIPVLLVFSGKRNLAQLLRITPNHEISPNVILCLNGIKVLSILWLILDHTLAYNRITATINSFDLTTWGQTAGSMLLQHVLFAVDTFFFISAFILSLITLRAMEKNNGKLNIPRMYLHRILRLAPIILLGILVYTFIIPLLVNAPNGPLFASFHQVCKSNWWSTLLCIQNYVNPADMCLPYTLYLAVDTQMFILSPIFLIALWKYRKFGVLGICAFEVALVICSFTTIMVNNYKLHVDGLYASDLELIAQTFYATHARTGPWIVGLLLGYYIFSLKGERLQIPKIVVGMGWIISLGLIVTIIFVFYPKARDSAPVSELEEAFYWSFGRIAWPLALAWIVLACENGYGGIVDEFLSHPLWQPLSKITFSLYMWNWFIVTLDAGRMKTSSYFSTYDLLLRFWGDLSWSILWSTLLYLAFEAPFVQLQKILLPLSKPELNQDQNDEVPTPEKEQWSLMEL